MHESPQDVYLSAMPAPGSMFDVRAKSQEVPCVQEEHKDGERSTKAPR